jgi:hypothetical protein
LQQYFREAGLTADELRLAAQAERNLPVPERRLRGEVLGPLFAREEFIRVARVFESALAELRPGGDPADAITDAGTALQEMLITLGAKGSSLGPLLASARNLRLFGPYDSRLGEGIEAIGEWVSAERSQQGDSHIFSTARYHDARLAVEIVGSLLAWLEHRTR